MNPADQVGFHRLPWDEFDELAQGRTGVGTVLRLREAERSRRLLLLWGLVEGTSKNPESAGPLPSFDEAWELLCRAEARSPAVFNELLSHPYTGSWLGYTTRLLISGTDGVFPLWVHLGHLHALAVTVAIRSGIDFQMAVPMWSGRVILPALGSVQLTGSRQWSTADVRGDNGCVDVSGGADRVRLPDPPDLAARSWWPVRTVVAREGSHRLVVRLDDVDPYRGLYEPIPAQRLSTVEFDAWRRLLEDAWRLVVDRLPDLADALPAGLDAIVPKPNVPFRNPSASTGEAFGSAIVARPGDAIELAATLIHEFRHIVLGGVLHLIDLDDDDPREYHYVPWRDDPRPLGRVIQGLYAFAGVTAFWRSLTSVEDRPLARRAAFEFAYWRGQTWRVLTEIRNHPSLTLAGRRFLEGIAFQLGPWRREPVAEDVVRLADAIAADHYAGWRIRHLRPSARIVGELARAWLAGHPRPAGFVLPHDPEPTPVPDGAWTHARTDLIRLTVTDPNRLKLSPELPQASSADRALASGRLAEAARGYQAELTADPDLPSAWVGLGLALHAQGTSLAARALLHHPELVRCVHRALRAEAGQVPSPRALAAWIGQFAG
ncbi:HEXXH motif domain-containing protein [Actinophytocola sp.]|uniref:HEXXH motif domain-containing protein n=1 Tax=Actinophytocola sp. TaxID=1872138 RepID=UPI002D80FB1F|nr:HEXXH motif-containing putative peptide modification protein [Actinophytocola sp.]HET9139007.1 HEXXH motif-containing putative peptide modification protein [Actinophytocola sp.]